jgi:LmbE family N-acetylglucosaminyl deacetylase
MKLTQTSGEIWTPDGTEAGAALARTTHMGISAHQDDIEIMAMDGILACFGSAEKWFTAVIATNGAGSPRDGLYAAYTDEEMQLVRRVEQKKAAFVGEYSAVAFLDHPSSVVKNAADPRPVADLKALLAAARPQIVYTHNLADKHDTHVSTALRAIAAIRELPPAERPRKLYGCEVWRDLDWLGDSEKVALPVSARSNIAAALVGVFDSQVTGGKRYDLATAGRRLAHATYYASHGTDVETALTFAMDLTPLVDDPSLAIAGFVLGAVDRFRADVQKRLSD